MVQVFRCDGTQYDIHHHISEHCKVPGLPHPPHDIMVPDPPDPEVEKWKGLFSGAFEHFMETNFDRLADAWWAKKLAEDTWQAEQDWVDDGWRRMNTKTPEIGDACGFKYGFRGVPTAYVRVFDMVRNREVWSRNG